MRCRHRNVERDGPQEWQLPSQRIERNLSMLKYNDEKKERMYDAGSIYTDWSGERKDV